MAIDKGKTVEQDLSNNYQSNSPYQTPDLLEWPPSLPFYPACDQYQLTQGSLSLQAQFSPQYYNNIIAQVHKKSPRKATPSPSGNDRFDQVPRTLNNSDWETLGTILTSLQQGEWITTRLPTPSPHSTNKEVPEFFMSRVFPTSSITPLWSVHNTVGVFSRWWRRRSNYGITKYHNPPVRLVGQSQFTTSHQACLQHTQSLGAQCQE